MKTIGEHKRTEPIGIDINSLHMVTCRDCGATGHAVDIETAEEHLFRTKCAPDCTNCKNLRRSFDKKPAVPTGGSCNDLTHVCPRDGNRWWQFNTHFHFWKQVTDPEEWDILLNNKSEVFEDF